MIGASLRPALPLVWLMLSGCTAANINVEPVAVSTQKPSNVAIYVAVSQHGAAVAGLHSEAFSVFENGVRLDSQQVQLTLLPTATAAARHVALLVDMSKPLSPDERKALNAALRPFIAKLRQTQAVSVYAFDGTAKARPLVEYTQDAHAEPDENDASLDRVRGPHRRDASGSLYTAVMDGAERLSAALAAEGRAIRAGTMVVVAMNPDLAEGAHDEQARAFIASSPHHYFLLTVGPWPSEKITFSLDKNRAARAASISTMSSPLANVARAVDDDYARDYLVSYCSPSRAGTHEVRLEVTTRDAKGKTSVGSYKTQFDAAGFGPGCDPVSDPRFVVASPKALPKTRERVANVNRPSPRPVGHAAAPGTTDRGVGPHLATPEASARSAAPVAEPPSGLGYE